jgi:hypothetical protein
MSIVGVTEIPVFGMRRPGWSWQLPPASVIWGLVSGEAASESDLHLVTLKHSPFNVSRLQSANHGWCL